MYRAPGWQEVQLGQTKQEVERAPQAGLQSYMHLYVHLYVYIYICVCMRVSASQHM